MNKLIYNTNLPSQDLKLLSFHAMCFRFNSVDTRADVSLIHAHREQTRHYLWRCHSTAVFLRYILPYSSIKLERIVSGTDSQHAMLQEDVYKCRGCIKVDDLSKATRHFWNWQDRMHAWQDYYRSVAGFLAESCECCCGRWWSIGAWLLVVLLQDCFKYLCKNSDALKLNSKMVERWSVYKDWCSKLQNGWPISIIIIIIIIIPAPHCNP